MNLWVNNVFILKVHQINILIYYIYISNVNIILTDSYCHGPSTVPNGHTTNFTFCRSAKIQRSPTLSCPFVFNLKSYCKLKKLY